MVLEGQVAIVTGASRGIGRNIALELAKAGADVVIAARSEEQPHPRLPGTIYETAEQVRRLGRRALPLKTDVTSDEDVANLVRQSLVEFGRIDILVNNAGIQAPGRVVDLPVRRWDLVWRVNVRGAFLCAQAVLPHMLERRQGTIVNISSVAAQRGSPGNISYGISKRALEMLAEGLAEEVREFNIKVFALAPEKLVLTEGAYFLGLPDRLPPGTQVEEPEVMGRAVVYLAAHAPMELSGRTFYSQPLLREFAQP